MTEGRPLTRLVILDGQVWVAGSVPPPEVAERIRNPKVWEPVEQEQSPAGPEGAHRPATGNDASAVIPAAPAPGGLVPPSEPTDPVATTVPAAATGTVVAQPDAVQPVEADTSPEIDGGAPPGDGVSEPGPGGAETAEPPRSGVGSGEAAWRAYAEAQHVDVADLDSRSEIITRLQERGVIQ